MAETEQIQGPARKRAPAQILDSKTFDGGRIYLYRRSDYKKPIWFCRVKVPGATGYVWKSTKTTDEHAAYKVADDLYLDSLVRVRNGEQLGSKRITDALRAYGQRYGSEQERLSVHYKVLLAQRLMPIFLGKTFDDLDTALISKMVDDLTARSKRAKLSPNTIKRIFADFRQFLNWCVEEGHLTKPPTFPKVSSDQARRPHFDLRDWNRLTRFLREHLKHSPKSVLRDRSLLINYVLVLANTGIRVGEARILKWRDLRPVAKTDGPSVTNVVLTVTGKTGGREVVARTPEIKKYFARILELRRADLTNPKSDIYDKKEVPLDSYVFCSSNGKPIGSFKKSFMTLLKEAGVERDSYGEHRSIYSLRHTYATFRLHEGVNHYALAGNMGTSVAMLESFYGHTSVVTAADELTKTSRKTRRYTRTKTSASFDWLSGPDEPSDGTAT